MHRPCWWSVSCPSAEGKLEPASPAAHILSQLYTQGCPVGSLTLAGVLTPQQCAGATNPNCTPTPLLNIYQLVCKEQSLAGKEVGEPSQALLCRAANEFWIRELSSRTSLSLHVVDLGHLAPLNLGSLIPKAWR